MLSLQDCSLQKRCLPGSWNPGGFQAWIVTLLLVLAQAENIPVSLFESFKESKVTEQGAKFIVFLEYAKDMNF